MLGTEHPLKFLNGGRALTSVLSRNDKVRELFYARFGERFVTVRDYYHSHRDRAVIGDVPPWLAELASDAVSHGGGDELI